MKWINSVLLNRSNIGVQTHVNSVLGDRVRVVKPTCTRRFVYDRQGRAVAEYGSSATGLKVEFIWAVPPRRNN